MADREVTIRLRADISAYSRDLKVASAETMAFGRSTDGLKGPLGNVESQSRSTGREIDKLSGRLRLAADAALILGPALGPLGAAAVGGVVALTAQLGALAGGLGVTLLATKGLGDGLKALDKYQLDPTTENLAKLNDEMKKLGPAGEDFVRFLDSIEPNLKSLQNAAREGLLPGAQEGIEELLQRLPEVRKLIRDTAEAMGDLFSDAGAAIAGERWDAFFKYLRTDGIQILDDTGRTIGNLAETVANLFTAFSGTSTDFSGGLLKFSQGLADASANLDSNQGFQEFLHYIEVEGPHALKTIGSIANAFLQIVEAAAPLGGPVLTVLGKFADVIAAIANSDFGGPIFAGLAALTLYNRALQVTASLSKLAAGVSPVGAGLVLGTATVLTFKGAWDKAGDSVEAFQSALQAASGDIATQTELIEGLRDAAAEMQDDVSSDGFFEGFKNAFDPDTYVNDFRESLGMDTGSEQLTNAADDAARALKNQRDGVDTLVAPLAGLRVGLEKATEAQQEQNAAINASVDAMRAQREEALRSANAELDYQQSIDDAKKALKENGKTVDETTDKGRNNLRALYNLAGAWNGQSQVIKDNSKALHAAKDNFIETAQQMGMTEGAARKLARQLFEIPTKRQIDITMDTHGATADLIALKARMDAIKSKTVRINVVSGPHAGGQTATDEQVPNSPGRGRTSSVPGRGRMSTPTVGDLAAMGNSAYALRNGGSDTAGAASPYHAVADEAWHVVDALKGLKDRLKQSEKALDKERQKRDDLQAQSDAFAAAVGSAYSTMDPFAAASGGMWGSGGGALSQFDSALSGNIANTQAAQSALGTAAGNGLDGPLYQALAASGNLALLQAFASLSAADIQAREDQFATQSAAQAGLGSEAAAHEFGEELKGANKRLDQVVDQVRELRKDVKATAKATGDAVGDKINSTASHGHRRGH